MIVDAIVQAFMSAVTALLSLIPVFTIPELQGTELKEAVSYGRVFNRIIPMQYMMTLVGITLVFHLGMVAFDGGVWLWHQIHGSD